jgi:hypothetical protein
MWHPLVVGSALNENAASVAASSHVEVEAFCGRNLN